MIPGGLPRSRWQCGRTLGLTGGKHRRGDRDAPGGDRSGGHRARGAPQRRRPPTWSGQPGTSGTSIRWRESSSTPWTRTSSPAVSAATCCWRRWRTTRSDAGWIANAPRRWRVGALASGSIENITAQSVYYSLDALRAAEAFELGAGRLRARAEHRTTARGPAQCGRPARLSRPGCCSRERPPSGRAGLA